MLTLPAELDRLLPTDEEKDALAELAPQATPLLNLADEATDLLALAGDPGRFPGAAVVGPSTQGARTLNVASFYWNVTNDTTRSTYLHIQTPWQTGSYRMFHFQARGYSLRAGTGNHGLHLHLVWSGYLYNTSLIETSHWDPAGVLAPTAYLGSDNHLYLRAGPTNWYATTLSLDSIYCTGGGVLTRADLAVTFSTSATL